MLIRDRETGIHRPVRAGDVAILFRTRESHREYERALEERGISAYVYKGLGFFDADEVKDVLAHPLVSCRSGLEPSICRVAALALRPDLGRGPQATRTESGRGPRPGNLLTGSDPAQVALDDDDDEALRLARASTARWRALADWLPPAELLDRILEESAYARELRVSAWRRRERT